MKVGTLDKQKYIEILNSKGLPDALTQLHHDMWQVENECFEGTRGYRPELYEALKAYRLFSTELWALRLADAKGGNPH